MNIEKLKKCIEEERYEIRRYAAGQIIQRNISLETVIEALLKGEVIEDYPGDKYYPSCLIFMMVQNRPIHVVAALDEKANKAYIVTTYEADSEHFNIDHIARKRR